MQIKIPAYHRGGTPELFRVLLFSRKTAEPACVDPIQADPSYTAATLHIRVHRPFYYSGLSWEESGAAEA